jgi:hypothetical protein
VLVNFLCDRLNINISQSRVTQWLNGYNPELIIHLFEIISD